MAETDPVYSSEGWVANHIQTRLYHRNYDSTAATFSIGHPWLLVDYGLVHRRAGDAKTAEKLYRFALDEFGDQLIVLRNLRKLLLSQSRAEEADRVQNRIVALPEPDPYPLLKLGDEAADKGKMDVALEYYRKAGDIAPYLHEVYLRIARIHVDNGDIKRAESALREARDRARDADDQERYEAKLGALVKH